MVPYVDFGNLYSSCITFSFSFVVSERNASWFLRYSHKCLGSLTSEVSAGLAVFSDNLWLRALPSCGGYLSVLQGFLGPPGLLCGFFLDFYSVAI